MKRDMRLIAVSGQQMSQLEDMFPHTEPKKRKRVNDVKYTAVKKWEWDGVMIIPTSVLPIDGHHAWPITEIPATSDIEWQMMVR